MRKALKVLKNTRNLMDESVEYAIDCTLIKIMRKRPLLNSGIQTRRACTGKGKVDDWLDFNQRLLNGDLTLPPTEV
jgi:hypothetical protein